MAELQRYKAVISYDGSAFSGFQIQPNGRTIQAELEKALAKMHKSEIVKIVGSGRTDAGVHAKGQVIHFDSPLQISVEQWKKGLNALLSHELVIMNLEKVASNFHARFDATEKTYVYKIYTQKTRDPFRYHYATHYPFSLNLDQIELAANYLVGTHDFTSFCSAKAEVLNKVRTVREIKLENMRDELIFTITGSGFLHNMVRIIVGTLLEVGSGKRNASDILGILQGCDRQLAGKTAPPQGLYLWKVEYNG
ncbi:tRNA pseudouridine38-40 synthase [Lederbergia galactosidilyticus]|uniref:tRNA pseudouridine(38-40) synthase TruA n=1 Tax=Lederbergia galactosidilytica TaxID=217031 RepID=UPI001AE8B762|nr:tRNA pseudouridine(38-40) synthase TruA [Lederbergia galactosidilytica]MBP1914389.1 tRNA pseudouridine38-40 synthase [Lederbergia galactosidilytica]